MTTCREMSLQPVLDDDGGIIMVSGPESQESRQVPRTRFRLMVVPSVEKKDGVTVDVCTAVNLSICTWAAMDPAPDSHANHGENCNCSQVWVNMPTGMIAPFQVPLEQASVHLLKEKIEDKHCIPVELQRLTFRGQQLSDDDRLWYYGVKSGSTVEVHLRLRGGQPLLNRSMSRSKPPKRMAVAKVVPGEEKDPPRSIPVDIVPFTNKSSPLLFFEFSISTDELLVSDICW